MRHVWQKLKGPNPRPGPAHPSSVYSVRKGRITSAQRRILAEDNSAYLLDTRHPLNWAERFGKTSGRRMVEIGFGNGEALIHDAQVQQDACFIGIEMYLSGLAAALLAIKRNAMTNVRLVRADATLLFPHYFQTNSLDVIRVFFPDPWPKRRHHKRRLLRPPFLAVLISCLRVDGKLHILTDWPDYAAQIDQALQERTTGTHLLTQTNALPLSKYGRRAQQEGRAIFQICFTKTDLCP